MTARVSRRFTAQIRPRAARIAPPGLRRQRRLYIIESDHVGRVSASHTFCVVALIYLRIAALWASASRAGGHTIRVALLRCASSLWRCVPG